MRHARSYQGMRRPGQPSIFPYPLIKSLNSRCFCTGAQTQKWGPASGSPFSMSELLGVFRLFGVLDSLVSVNLLGRVGATESNEASLLSSLGRGEPHLGNGRLVPLRIGRVVLHRIFVALDGELLGVG